MVKVDTIKFTQDQMRTLTGLSVETVRHWRKTIPYLSSKTGKAARFTFADLLSLAVTHELVSSFGVHIATLRVGVDSLFRTVAASRPASLDSAIVFITANGTTLYETVGEGIGRVPTNPALVIPLAPLVAKIHQRMLPFTTFSNQIELPFSPETELNK